MPETSASGPAGQVVAIEPQRAHAGAVGVVAVQADLTSSAAQHVERRGDAPPVGPGLVAVLPVRMAGDDVERGPGAARVFTAEQAGEGPGGVAAPRQVHGGPLAQIAELAAQSAAVAAAQGAGAAHARGGEAARGPAPHAVHVVGESDGEAAGGGRPVAPQPSARRKSFETELGQARREERAQQGDVAVAGRLLDLERRVGGEHAGGVRQTAEAVALVRGVLVPAGQEGEGGGDEVERQGEAVVGRGREGSHDVPGRRLQPREGAAGQRPSPSEEVHGAGVTRDRRHAGDRRRRIGERAAACGVALADQPHAPAQRRQERVEHPLRPRRERGRRVDEDVQSRRRGHSDLRARARPAAGDPQRGLADGGSADHALELTSQKQRSRQRVLQRQHAILADSAVALEPGPDPALAAEDLAHGVAACR